MAIRSRGMDAVFEWLNVAIMLLVVVAVSYPLIFVLSASVSNPLRVLNGEVWLWPKEWTFNAYTRIFHDSDILTGYRNSLLYTLAGVSINLALTVAGAYPLSRKDLVGRNAVMAFIVFTMFFSGGIVPTYLIVKKLHMLNTFWSMVLPGAVSVWNLIIMRTFFEHSIPKELEESARMDGSSNLRLLFSIVLPLSMPILAVILLYYAVSHWNTYFNALMYLSDRNKYTLQLFIRELLVQGQMQDMMSGDAESIAKQQMLAESLKYAVIAVSSLPVLILYPFLQKYFVKGMLVGAVKG